MMWYFVYYRFIFIFFLKKILKNEHFKNGANYLKYSFQNSIFAKINYSGVYCRANKATYTRRNETF